MSQKYAAEHQKLLKNLNIAVQYLLVQAKGQVVVLQTPGVLGLRLSLEAILTHGLKGKLWEVLQFIANKLAGTDVLLETVKSLPHVRTDRGRARALVHAALNAGRISGFMSVLMFNQDFCRDKYQESSIVRSQEHMQMLVMILDQITSLQFVLLLNDGTLDQEKLSTPASRQGSPAVIPAQATEAPKKTPQMASQEKTVPSQSGPAEAVPDPSPAPPTPPSKSETGVLGVIADFLRSGQGTDSATTPTKADAKVQFPVVGEPVMPAKVRRRKYAGKEHRSIVLNPAVVRNALIHSPSPPLPDSPDVAQTTQTSKTTAQQEIAADPKLTVPQTLPKAAPPLPSRDQKPTPPPRVQKPTVAAAPTETAPITTTPANPAEVATAVSRSSAAASQKASKRFSMSQYLILMRAAAIEANLNRPPPPPPPPAEPAPNPDPEPAPSPIAPSASVAPVTDAEAMETTTPASDQAGDNPVAPLDIPPIDLTVTEPAEGLSPPMPESPGRASFSSCDSMEFTDNASIDTAVSDPSVDTSFTRESVVSELTSGSAPSTPTAVTVDPPGVSASDATSTSHEHEQPQHRGLLRLPGMAVGKAVSGIKGLFQKVSGFVYTPRQRQLQQQEDQTPEQPDLHRRHSGGRKALVLLKEAQMFSLGQDDDGGRAPDTVFNPRIPNLIATIFEQGTPEEQDGKCYSCNRPLPTGFFTKPRYCHYSGKYYCHDCHKGDRARLPAYVLHEWDFHRREVCRAAKDFLDANYEHPILSIQKTNPKLYEFVPQLRQLRAMRFQLHLMAEYILSCRKNSKKLIARVNGRDHLLEVNGGLCMRDLVDLGRGSLRPFLLDIMDLYEQHITNRCELCYSRGYFCEFCNSKELVFPFQFPFVVQCEGCKSFFHKHCYVKEHCPVCERQVRIRGRHGGHRSPRRR